MIDPKWINTWIQFACGKCGSLNWYNDGDTTDCTAYAPDALACWNCKEKWLRSDGFEPDDQDREPNVDVCRQSPV